MPGYILYSGTSLSRDMGDNFYKLDLSTGMIKIELKPTLADIIQIIKLIFICSLGLIHFQLCLASDDKSSEMKNKEIFDSRKMQLEFLTQQNPPADSLFYHLLKEAQYFAEHDDFTTALEFLDMAIQTFNENILLTKPLYSNDSISTNPLNIPPAHLKSINKAWDITLEAGTDYSRQEYELTFIESDSVILEELHNPYAAIRLSKSGNINNKNTQIFGYLRGDNSLFQSSVSASLESMNFRNNWRIEGQSDIFWFTKESGGRFWNNEIRGFLTNHINQKNRIFIYSKIRYKKYFPSTINYSDIFHADINFSWRYNFHILSWMELVFRPSIYRENQVQGYNYTQYQTQFNLDHRVDYHKYIYINTILYLRKFQSKQISEEYHNQFYTLQPIVDAEHPIIYPFGIQMRIHSEGRRYKEPDINYSNFIYTSIGTQLKYYLGTFKSIGCGYIYENEKHSSNISSDKAIIEQENFNAKGFIISFELLSFKGLMISVSYQYILRNYPNAGADDFFGSYSNRLIQNIQGFGYIPINEHWQFQFFANYDNDRDRDRDSNDNFNTIFNLGFVYKF